jgi:hypothetical protein
VSLLLVRAAVHSSMDGRVVVMVLSVVIDV